MAMLRADKCDSVGELSNVTVLGVDKSDSVGELTKVSVLES